MKLKTPIFIMMMLIPVQDAHGLWNPIDKKNFSLGSPGKDVGIQPLKIQQLSPFRSLSLFQKKTLSFKDSIQSYLGNQLGFAPISLKSNRDGLSLTGAQNVGFRFQHQGVDICGYEVRAQELRDGSTFVLGNMPQVDDRQWISPEDWPSFSYVQEQVFESLNDWHQNSEAQVNNKEKCFFVDNGSLHPAWKVMFNIDGVGHRVIADQYRVFQHEKMIFDVEGKIKGYDKNPYDGTVKSFNVTLEGNGYLENSYFTTTTGVHDRAFSEENVFEYETSDPEFAETTSFLAASRMYDYFRSLGYSWKGPRPLGVNLHVTIAGTKNNALYQPAESTRTGKPSISIGDGDGKQLANLPYDVDVVAHEFGHHVVYSTLSSIVGESLILHEGLADFFAFARTGDSCLGESICPEQSLACWEKAQCLRTASNKIRYDDQTYLSLEAHLKGQVVSGFLWDLYENEGIPLSEVAGLAYKAVSLLISNSGTKDLIMALFAADKDEGGDHACKIYSAAMERGFGDHLEGVDCKKSGTFGDITGVSNKIEPSNPTVKTKSNTGGCGVAGQTSSSSGMLMLMLLAGMPAWMRRKKS